MPYVSLPNKFRQDLQAGKTLIGCWASLASNISTEILGYAGFDWILIDGEHGPNDIQTFITQLQALKDSVSAPFVRPQWAEPVILKRLLDIGFFNFLMPFIDTPEQAKAAVAATRYPPQGTRGIGVSHRANKFGYVPDYHAQINDNITVAVQIESLVGIENAGRIAAVEGVDCLFIGPSDLSAALGQFGKLEHPDVIKAMEHIHASAREHGKATGILAPVEKDARRYLEMGISFVAVGADTGLFRSATRTLCERFKGGL
ncbi:MAG TPA: 2-dehydro-3-deoxyglucarate aldolase [Polyangia bacterium]|jgi:2-dehydro-3-deoxyglucarate aldolase|nr:2-dehydro-3-deoxyglucarate aldolase [Polyangia bacterium]